MDSTSTPPATTSHADQGAMNGSLVRRFLELIRFSHTVFALPFALLASLFAIVVPRSVTELSTQAVILRSIAVILCMVSARSAAMAFNRIVDARIDARNPRTANRHIPAGSLSTIQVGLFCIVMCLAFLFGCSLFLPNFLPLVFSVPVLAWICGYSFAKRFTAYAHLWLGSALALSPICAWIAIRGEELMALPGDILPAVWLALAIALWVAGFDMIYACQDADFDRQAGLKSVPARFGIAGALRIAAALHVVMLIVLATLPRLFPKLSLGLLYYVCLTIIAALVLWQHSIVSPTDLKRVGVAFFNINALISFLLCAAAAIDALL